jgi:hypothetical protein
MADLCGDGSIIAQDFYSKAIALGEYSKSAKSFIRVIGRGVDLFLEPV